MVGGSCTRPDRDRITMFRLAAFTDEISKDLAYACGVLNEFGVEGAELRGVWETAIHTLTDDEAREVKRILDDHGLVVCSLASPFGKCELDNPGEIAEHMGFLRRGGEIGHAPGC